MWKDPIVQETRDLQEQYAAQFARDAKAIFQDILRRQMASSGQFVSFQPIKPAVIERGAG